MKKNLCFLILIVCINGCSSPKKVITKKTVQVLKFNKVNQKLLKEARLYSSTAYAFYKSGKYKAAIKDYEIAIKNLLLIDNAPEIAKVHNNIGTVYIKIGKWNKALYHLNTAYAINKKYGAAKEMSNNLGAIGLIFESKKQYDKALVKYQEALKILLTLPRNYHETAAQYNNIGYILLIKGKYKGALLNFNKSLKLNIALRNYISVAETYSHIGQIYLKEKKPKKALFYYNNALNADKAVENSSGIASDLKNIGKCYEALTQYKLAAEHFLRAIRINNALQLPRRVMSDLKNLIRIYTKLKNKKKIKELKRHLYKLKRSLRIR